MFAYLWVQTSQVDDVIFEFDLLLPTAAAVVVRLVGSALAINGVVVLGEGSVRVQAVPVRMEPPPYWLHLEE